MPVAPMLPSAVPRSGAAGARPSSPESQGEASAATFHDDDQAERNRRHAVRDQQIASAAAYFATHPEAMATLERQISAHKRRELNRRNAEDNLDYVEGFEERWDDPHASLKRGP